MSAIPVPEPAPPVVAAVGAARVALAEAAECPGWGLADPEVVALLDELFALRAQAEALLAAQLSQARARGLDVQFGCRDVPGWLRRRFRLSAREAARLGELSAGLGRWERVGEALRAGELGAEAAGVLVRALDALPGTAGPAERDRAAALLVEQAGTLSPEELTRCGQAIREALTITPDVDDPAEAARMEAEAARREESRWLSIRRRRDGMIRLEALFDPVAGAQVRTGLDARAEPHPDHDGLPDPRSRRERLADALHELCTTPPDRPAPATTRPTGEPGAPGAPAETGEAEQTAGESADTGADPDGAREDTGGTTDDTRGGTDVGREPREGGAGGESAPAGQGGPAREGGEAGQTGEGGQSGPAAEGAPVAEGGETGQADEADEPVEIADEGEGVGGSAGTGQAGGGARPVPQVGLIVNYEALLARRARAGVLDDGTELSCSQLLGLLCEAAVLPVVFAGPAQPIHLGRRRRTFSPAQRGGLDARDRGCAWPGCQRPPNRCTGHHMIHWVDGGPTALDNGCLLCPSHHRLVHRENWAARLAGNGYPEFIPPASYDPHRRPRQHLRYRM